MRLPSSGVHANRVLGATNDVNGALAANIVPAISDSWRRCIDQFHLDPAGEAEPQIVDAVRLDDSYAEYAELIQIAQVELEALYEQIAGSGYALLLADISGVILCQKVDPTLRRLFAKAGLVIGADWSEQCEGTNGVGTCVREARPITVHQGDHFRARHAHLTCSAAPIHDHLGRMIAVIDASSVGDHGGRKSQHHTMALLRSSARLIDKCLFLRAHSKDVVLRFHPRAELFECFHDGAIAIGVDGTITAADRTALDLLGGRQRDDVVGRSVADVFDVSWEGLLSGKASRTRRLLPLRDQVHGRRYYASLVERDDDPFALLPAALPQRRKLGVFRQESIALTLEDLAGEDPQMLRNARNARRVADCDVSVLLQGPTGSGKEVFAKALHLNGDRARGPFVAVNCASIPESLIESELFGYASGAFTGARRGGLRGRIAQATGGTLFLDEIGDMPLLLQTRLLRVLEEREVTPLGSEEVIKVDIRIVCASHRDLRKLVGHGEFREDLYYRLNGLIIELPPVSKRRDKALLIERCIARELGPGIDSVSLENDALRRLLAYDWPGNVRQLRSVIRTAAAICDDGIIRLSDLPDEIRGEDTASPKCTPGGEATQAGVTLESGERAVLIEAIEGHNWVMSRVARELGISRNTLYRKIKMHGIPLLRPAPASV